MDKPKAVAAAARSAHLHHADPRQGIHRSRQDYYKERYRECDLRPLSQRAAKLGVKMVALEQPA